MTIATASNPVILLLPNKASSDRQQSSPYKSPDGADKQKFFGVR